ncbi:MAG: DUF1698 domain-containing protein [Pseudomonadota bacterium]
MASVSIPKPPAGFSPEEFFADIHWHQEWDLFEGVKLPGRNPVSTLCDYAGLPQDLTGKSVLDIGAWHGAFSFECERRGADRVLAFSLEDPEATGFNRLKEVLNSNVEYKLGSVYSLQDYDLGTFDVVLFFGVLYHLRYPLLSFDRLRDVCKDTGAVYIETHILLENADRPMWVFYPADDLLGDPSNWFSPNVRAVIDGMNTAGFDTVLTGQWGDRAAFRADAVGGDPHAGTYEGVSDEVRQRLSLRDNRTG